MSSKTTIQNKVSKKVNQMFNGYAQTRGIKKDAALEEAMQMYIDKCKKEDRGRE